MFVDNTKVTDEFITAMNKRKHPASTFGALSTDDDGEQVRLRRPEPQKDENLKRLTVDHDCDIAICASGLLNLMINLPSKNPSKFKFSIEEYEIPATGEMKKVLIFGKMLPMPEVSSRKAADKFYKGNWLKIFDAYIKSTPIIVRMQRAIDQFSAD